MTTLKERLDHMKANPGKVIPAAAKATMSQATQELRDSGILSRIPAPGSQLPPFELPDSDGAIRRSADFLAHGPLILTFYRGGW